MKKKRGNKGSAERPLTARKLLFVEKYFELKFNGTAAYLAAYPNVKKRATAWVNASKLLSSAKVQAEVDRRKREMQTASQDIVDRIREELEYLAFARIGTYLSFDSKGVKLKSSKNLTSEELAAVAEVIQQKEGIRLKLHSKKDSLELLMKYYGLIVEKKEHTGKVGAPLGEGLVDMKRIMEDIRQSHQPGTLWNEGKMLEDGDL